MHGENLIYHICSEKYLQNVFLYTFFPQSFFIISLWKLEYVPFVRSHKIGGCDPCKQSPAPSALGSIAHYHWTNQIW